MKKLLILGGGVHESFLVNRAHLLGYYTIVTEHYDNGQCSPAKQYANESWDIVGMTRIVCVSNAKV